jgi:ribosomal protein S8
MSEEESKPALVEHLSNDFSQKDLEVIKAYQEAGLPAVATVDEKKMASMLEMYLSGKTYRQISTTMQIKKDIVLYMSFKFNWFELRQDYLVDMESSMRGRVLEAKIVNQDFLLQLQAMWQKKIGTNIAKYLATDNVEFANQIDLKEVDKYLKTVELLQKLSVEGKPVADNTRPLIGVNAGDGVTIVRTGENSMEITPKSKAIGDALKMFADSRREDEKKPSK